MFEIVVGYCGYEENKVTIMLNRLSMLPQWNIFTGAADSCMLTVSIC